MSTVIDINSRRALIGQVVSSMIDPENQAVFDLGDMREHEARMHRIIKALGDLSYTVMHGDRPLEDGCLKLAAAAQAWADSIVAARQL